MTNLRKVAEQALEAFEKIYEGCGEVKKDDLNKHSNGLAILVRKDCLPRIEALRQALAQPSDSVEQEPVAWANSSDLENFDMRVRTNRDHYHTVPLYTAPPKREWVGLTEAERIDIIDDEITSQNTEHFALAQTIEARLKEKNT